MANKDVKSAEDVTMSVDLLARVIGNLGYRPWMGRHLAHSFYAWPKPVFIRRRHVMEP